MRLCGGVGVSLRHSQCVFLLYSSIYLSFYMRAVFSFVFLSGGGEQSQEIGRGMFFLDLAAYAAPRRHPNVSSGNKRGNSGVQPVLIRVRAAPVSRQLTPGLSHRHVLMERL